MDGFGDDMKRVLLFRPDVSVPLPVLVSFMAGAAGGIAGFIWLFTHLASPFTALPVISASLALMAVLPWNLRHQPRPVNFGGRRLAIVLIVAGAVMALQAIRTRGL
jgi:hypothetical protein